MRLKQLDGEKAKKELERMHGITCKMGFSVGKPY